MARHGRESFFVVGEGLLTPNTDAGTAALADGATTLLSEVDAMRQFRFSRIGPPGTALSTQLAAELADKMTASAPDQDSAIPSGFTYLGQFVDHDLTMDKTATVLGSDVTVDELVQGRSPSLDLDSLYRRGPTEDPQFYSDGLHLKMGRTSAVGDLPELDGFDLPRDLSQVAAVIGDPRNDENLAVAQTHLAFIRFHNRVVDNLAPGPGSTTFARARSSVTKHYQWMLRTDYLPRIVDPGIVEDVFTNGRKLFEKSVPAGDAPTMPIEFSVAAFRLGHSMVRADYDWNRIFDNGGGSLDLLFAFSGTSGGLTNGTRLPSNWIADFRRLYNFAEAGRLDLAVPLGKFNFARRIDTRLTNPLANLPPASFGEAGPVPPPQANLAFRNLIRGTMVKLASGQQMAALAGVAPLTDAQILTGEGGVDLSSLAPALAGELTSNTPLWLYILREAEFNNGQLTGVGGRIVAEVFHRAMEGSEHSIVRDPSWRPNLGPNPLTFRMVDLLLFAFEGRADLLNPVGDKSAPPVDVVVLRRGDKGFHVKILQHLLRARAFGVKADGDFGPATETAVRQFQGSQGIGVDGVVGTITWSRLFITVRLGSTGEAVKGVQVRMKERKLGPITVDGEFGPITEAAVRDFQQDKAIPVDGVVGAITWRQCVSEPA